MLFQNSAPVQKKLYRLAIVLYHTISSGVKINKPEEKMKSIRILTAILAFAAIGAQAQQLYLGDGASLSTTNGLTWDTNSLYWATDLGGSNWVTWTDGNDAHLPGASSAISIYLDQDLAVSVNDLVYDYSLAGNGGANIWGTSNGTETVTINGTAYTLGATKQFTVRRVELGGTFTISNTVSQFVLGTDATIAPGTQITTKKRITLDTELVDYSGLTLTLDGGGAELKISNDTNKIVSAVSGTGSFTPDSTLLVSNLTVGTEGTIVTNSVSGSGTLALGGGTHKFDVNNSGGVLSNDRLQGFNIEVGGTLEISIAPGSDTLAVSNVFELTENFGITGGSFSAVDTNNAVLSAGLSWGTDQLNFGRIYVTDGTFVPVEPPRPVPVANDDSYNMLVPFSSNLVVSAPGILENDTIEGPDALSVILDTDVTSGTLNLSSDGSFDYTPDTLVAGSDSFTYKTITAYTTSSVATVTITINEAKTVLHYTFDSDFTDSSASGNDGTASGGAVITNTAKFGTGSMNSAGTGALTFSSVAFADTEDWSLSLWYNATTTVKGHLIGRGTALNHTLVYNQSGGADRNYYLRGSGSSFIGTWTATEAPTALDTGVWHHLAITCTGVGNDLNFYEDGVEITGWPSGDGTGMTFDRLLKGRASFGIFNGLIDEVRIMNYDIGIGGVTNLYNVNSLDGSTDDPVTNAAATIVSAESAPSNTLKVVVSLEAGSLASEYSPKAKTDLVNGATWDPVAHSATFDGTFAVTNLDIATAEGTNLAIYVQTTNSAEFIQIEAPLIQE
jgi:hypothetical protein